MSYQTLQVSIENDICTIALNRPEVMNALNSEMRAELTTAITTCQNEARVIVMTGTGRAFCSGQDLGDATDLASLDLAAVLRDEYVPMLKAIYGCKVPTIAAVNGVAAGAGANLALAADIVIASEAASFVQAFTQIGLIPDAGGTYWLPRQVGFARAMGAALFGDKISAKLAADWGMIYEAVAADEFETHWQMRAAYLARGATEAYRHTKAALRGSFENGLEAQLAVEAELQAKCGKTDDFAEGVHSFLEKRPAKFTGR
ncbi:MAG: enoyl-CoA hydratase/isomerase family protein [Rhodobacteraceae bacterium]|nr:enoyl-CoA hydratase/isomerase family protein [Paracoccaceae bacterium]